MGGVGNNLFAPDVNISRQEMAVMLHRYADFMGIEIPSIRTGSFADEDKISDWAIEAARVMYEADIINGRGDSIFDPQAGASRAEVVTLLMRFLQDIV